MPRNGSGTYSLPQPAFVAGTVISSAAVNSDLSDIASALTGSLPRDGQAGMTGQLKLPDGSTSSPSITFTNEPTTGFSRATTGTIAVDILGVQIATITSAGWVGPVQGSAPVGTVVDFAGPTPPAQWYLCFGQAVSRTTYAALFGVIGTVYGVGDGSTTFNLPDLRGYAVVGNDHMGGSSSGRVPPALTNNGGTAGQQNTTLSIGQIPNITSSANNAISVSIVGGGLNNGSIPAVLPGFSITAYDEPGAAGVTGIFVPSAASGGWGAVSSLTNPSQAISVNSQSTGAGTVVPTLQPSFALNKMIFAGV